MSRFAMPRVLRQTEPLSRIVLHGTELISGTLHAYVGEAARKIGQSHAMSANFPNLPAAIAAYSSRPGQSQASLSRALNLSRASVTRWMHGDEPEVKRIKEVAKELGVSVGYLAGDEEMPGNDDELNVLKGFRQQPESIKRAIRQLAQTIQDDT